LQLRVDLARIIDITDHSLKSIVVDQPAEQTTFPRVSIGLSIDLGRQRERPSADDLVHQSVGHEKFNGLLRNPPMTHRESTGGSDKELTLYQLFNLI